MLSFFWNQIRRPILFSSALSLLVSFIFSFSISAQEPIFEFQLPPEAGGPELTTPGSDGFSNSSDDPYYDPRNSRDNQAPAPLPDLPDFTPNGRTPSNNHFEPLPGNLPTQRPNTGVAINPFIKFHSFSGEEVGLDMTNFNPGLQRREGRICVGDSVELEWADDVYEFFNLFVRLEGSDVIAYEKKAAVNYDQAPRQRRSQRGHRRQRERRYYDSNRDSYEYDYGPSSEFNHPPQDCYYKIGKISEQKLKAEIRANAEMVADRFKRLLNSIHQYHAENSSIGEIMGFRDEVHRMVQQSWRELKFNLVFYPESRGYQDAYEDPDWSKKGVWALSYGEKYDQNVDFSFEEALTNLFQSRYPDFLAGDLSGLFSSQEAAQVDEFIRLTFFDHIEQNRFLLEKYHHFRELKALDKIMLGMTRGSSEWERHRQQMHQYWNDWGYPGYPLREQISSQDGSSLMVLYRLY